jgi:GTP cyclohydrolase I
METLTPNSQAAASALRQSAQAQPRIAGAITTLLEHIGEDVTRDGLLDTPARVARAWMEMTAGYEQNPADILGRVFEQDYQELVILRGCFFYSFCEHHLLPFSGEAVVGYRPGKVVGISKLARLVECYAKRLQIQERFTQQIGFAVQEHLDARAVGVVIKAQHLCMACRGVRQAQTKMITQDWRGSLAKSDRERREFLQLAYGD